MYYYLTHYKKTIENTDFICIKLLFLDRETHKTVILTTYKRYTNDLKNTLDDLNCFCDLTDYIGFTVRNDGKVVASLNI